VAKRGFRGCKRCHRPPNARSVRSDNRETPVRRQYESLKAQYPDCILLFQLGDFFETFEGDAKIVSRLCGITLTPREFGKGDRAPLAGVPVTRLDHYLARLIEAGLHVAVAEQVSPPGNGLVERVVTRVVTPGTLAEPGLLREKENNYLAAILRGRTGVGLAYVDVTTGEFAATQLDGDDVDTRLRTEMERLGPAEVLVLEGQELDLPRAGHRTVCQPWRFGESAARERLCAQFGVLSLEGFGCAHLPLASRAAGAILSYLEENNRRLLPNLVDLRTYSTGTGMILDGYTRRNLELTRNGRTGRVERPTSVVRELLDNAIDAGAANVTIELRGGGLELIRVTDDGCGIPPDEVELAFCHHATSKLASLEDLLNLRTLGFRGEALPSIAAVAEVDMLTRDNACDSGTQMIFRAGEVIRRRRAARQRGTTVTVRHLFHNVPARLKFLSVGRGESLLVGQLVRRYALRICKFCSKRPRPSRKAGGSDS
jgi:hypothetical protein